MGLTSDQIIKRASQCLKKGQNKISAEVALGIAFYEKGDIDTAIGHYLNALVHSPDNAEAHAGLGMSYARQGNHEKSLVHLEKSWLKNPDCSLLANWLADAYFDAGNLDRAIELYAEALRLNASDNNAQNDMADAYRLKGDFVKALELYDRAIAIDPGDTNAMLEKGQCLIALKRPEEALSCLTALIETFPASRDSATAMVVCGTILARTRQFNKASAWFEKALEFFPFNRQVLLQAASCAMNNGEHDKARSFLNSILDLNPADQRAAELLNKVGRR